MMKDKISILRTKTFSREFGLDYQLVQFGKRSYPLFYGDSVLPHLGVLLQDLQIRTRVMVVSHPEVRHLFGEQTEQSLRDSGYAVDRVIFPSGEQYKNLETVATLYAACADAKIDKSSALLALGGGVVQDVTNYVAATYMRGVPFVQVPTTVLSQADVGIGGCAIDHPAGKSLIGQFYQPRFVVMDFSVLRTLPETEVTNGLAEIINKVLCLGGFGTDCITEDISQIKSGDWARLGEYIRLSNKVKKGIIEKDEVGIKGSRLLLDFGHTITYALERTLDYAVSHGWALGIGMYGAAVLSHQMGCFDHYNVEKLRKIIETAGLPTNLPSHVDIDKLLGYMALDQKVKEGQNRFVLLRDFGDAFVSDYIDEQSIKECLVRLK